MSKREYTKDEKIKWFELRTKILATIVERGHAVTDMECELVHYLLCKELDRCETRLDKIKREKSREYFQGLKINSPQDK